MIEILILYILNKREKTIYSVRKEIIEQFGHFTVPSLGTIYPALKRLLVKKCVQVSERMSEGGKKSSYYQITEQGRKLFRDLFFEGNSENPSILFSLLHAKLATMGMLTLEDRQAFLAKVSKNIDIHIFDMENKLKDEFINFDKFQLQLLKLAIAETNTLKNFVSEMQKLS